MNFKKLFKRETKVIAYVVIALTLVVIGTSYALFLQVNNNSNNQVVKAGSLTITYSQGNVINIDSSKNNCLTPQSDSSAVQMPGAPSSMTGNACKYELSITNNGTLPMQYDILVYDDATGLPSGASLVNHNLIKYNMRSVKTDVVQSPSSAPLTSVTGAKVLGSQTVTNGKKVLKTDTIEVGKTTVITLFIWISDTATVDIINQYVSLKLDVVGSVKEASGENYDLPVCKRATTLHTETCTSSCSWGCQGIVGTGNLIRYGNLGTSGKLTSGDAFDCDVNGDGTFDSQTERFYYVSDLDSNTAVLIYYSNISCNGACAGTQNTPFASSGSSPTDAIKLLPTANYWPNVSLNGTTRDLLDMSSSKITTIDYSGKVARLLTYQDLVNAGINNSYSGSNTPSGRLRIHPWLIEGTGYGNVSSSNYWLASLSDSAPMYVNGSDGSVYVDTRSSQFSVRPVIEVPKSRIQY